jgi:putative hydrolase of the HAD superfamily
MSANEFFEGIAATTGGGYTPEEVRLVHDAWILGEYEGVGDLIDELHARDGLRTGVLSNTNDTHWRLMGPQRSMAPMRVHHPHASHLLGHVKPEPEIFRAFENATGHQARSILLFDDIEENVRAARRAGWHAHQVDHTRETEPQMRAHLASLGLL